MKKIAFIILSLLLACTLAEARKVTGRVHCGDEPLSGVIVTDGAHFARTRANGKFRLKVSDGAKFVFVVTPSGYTADFSSGAPQFYRRAEGEKTFDFDLLRARDVPGCTLFSVSDPQFKDERQFAQFCGKPLEDLIARSGEYGARSNTAGVALGDICWDSYEFFEPYKREIARTGIPFYAVIGNHDHNKDKVGDEACREDFEAAFGPVDYAFFLGDDLVICLDNIIYEGGKKYEEGYTDRELDFVAGLLEHIPADTHLFIAQHSPLYRWWNKTDIIGAEELLSLLDGYSVDFLSGHTHIQNNLSYSADIQEHNAPSICGAWWDTEYCHDGTPRGYQIFTCTDGSLSWITHPIDHPDSFQYEIILPGQSAWHPDAIVANIWDYDADWSVDWYQDGNPKGAMEEVLDCSPTFIRQIERAHPDGKIPGFKKPRRNVHYFAARPDSTARHVDIVIRSRNGDVWQEGIELNP